MSNTLVKLYSFYTQLFFYAWIKTVFFSSLSIKDNVLFMQVQSVCVCVPWSRWMLTYLEAIWKTPLICFDFFFWQGLVTGSTYGTDLEHYSNEHPLPLLSFCLPNQHKNISALKAPVILVGDMSYSTFCELCFDDSSRLADFLIPEIFSVLLFKNICKYI